MSDRELRDPLESMLVAAARSQRAPRAARARIRAAVGLAAGAGALTAASTAAAATGKQAMGALTALGIAKYVAVGAACGVLTLGVARVAAVPERGEATIPQVPSAHPVTSSARPVPVPASLPSAIASDPVPESSAAPPPVSVPQRASAPSVPALAGELAVLDEARVAVRRRDPATAIRVLDDYAREFPRGQMSSEAMVLRIQALVQSGNRPAAEALANSFEHANPRSPLVERVRGILGHANP